MNWHCPLALNRLGDRLNDRQDTPSKPGVAHYVLGFAQVGGCNRNAFSGFLDYFDAVMPTL